MNERGGAGEFSPVGESAGADKSYLSERLEHVAGATWFNAYPRTEMLTPRLWTGLERRVTCVVSFRYVLSFWSNLLPRSYELVATACPTLAPWA